MFGWTVVCRRAILIKMVALAQFAPSSLVARCTRWITPCGYGPERIYGRTCVGRIHLDKVGMGMNQKLLSGSALTWGRSLGNPSHDGRRLEIP